MITKVCGLLFSSVAGKYHYWNDSDTENKDITIANILYLQLEKEVSSNENNPKPTTEIKYDTDIGEKEGGAFIEPERHFHIGRGCMNSY